MTPEQEQQVARALAAAGGSPAAPADVTARLDAVLAGLVEARAADPPAGIATLRRRRRRRSLVVAAAAACVVALGGAAVTTGGFGVLGGSESSTSADRAASTDHGGTEGQTAGSGAEPSTPPSSAGGTAPGRRAVSAAVPRLNRATLRHDARRLLSAGDLARLSAAGPAGCVDPAVGSGDRLVAVRLDGRLATLVVHPERAGERHLQVYPCRDPSAPLASTVVPVR